MSRLLGQLVGAFLITFLASRLGFWILKRWDGGVGKIATVHLCSFALLNTLYAFGSADGGPPKWTAGVMLYGFPLLVWFVIDLVRGTGDVEPKDAGLAETFE